MGEATIKSETTDGWLRHCLRRLFPNRGNRISIHVATAHPHHRGWAVASLMMSSMLIDASTMDQGHDQRRPSPERSEPRPVQSPASSRIRTETGSGLGSLDIRTETARAERSELQPHVNTNEYYRRRSEHVEHSIPLSSYHYLTAPVISRDIGNCSASGLW